MSNFSYKNIQEITRTNTPTIGQVISEEQLELLEKTIVVPSIDLADTDTSIELHVFLSNLTYLRSEYNLKTSEFQASGYENNTPSLKMNIHKDLQNLKLPANSYKIVYNFHKNFIGSVDSKDQMFISEISNDRTEIKLSLVNQDSQEGKNQLAKFLFENFKPKKFIPPIILNFGQNKIYDVINVTSIGETTSFYVKLYEPLPDDIDIYFKCWIAVRVRA